MAKKQDSSAVKVDVGLSAKAEFRAEIKAEIPRESSGRLLDALTDIIRPFSERRGLRADLIRLQREDVLIKIAKLAHQRFEEEAAKPEPVPNKFLVSFLEKASLEDIDSELLDRWVSLLHAAATEFDATMVRHTTVLSEVGSREVKLLDRLCRGSRSYSTARDLDRAPNAFTESVMAEEIRDILSMVGVGEKTKDDVSHRLDNLIENWEVPGAIICSIETSIYDHAADRYHEGFPINDESDEIAISILEGLGVIRELVLSARTDEHFAFAHCLHLTRYGLLFVLACDAEARKKHDTAKRF